MSCNVSSSGDDAKSKLTIQWIHNGKPIEKPQCRDNGRILNINRSSKNDSGVYGCIASNIFGNAYKELQLQVQEGKFHIYFDYDCFTHN